MSLNSRMRVLFEQDTFALLEDVIKATKETQVDVHSWIYHHPCDRHSSIKLTALATTEIHRGVCIYCHKKIPDELLALWRLHNWDYELIPSTSP